jgi:glycosyltransferase involved in cell wall biosynthesis
MRILIIHEIDWKKKVIFEPHHLAELFNIQGHEVFVIDCAQPNSKEIIKGIHTRKIINYSRIYNDSTITLIRPPSLLIKGLNRATHYFSCNRVIEKTIKKENIDIILLYGVATNGIQTIKISKELQIPVIFRLLDIAHEFVKIPILQQITKKFEKEIYQKSNTVLTTTNHLVKYANKIGNNKNAEKFPYGVNTKIFYPTPKELKLINKLGISSIDKILMFMGTIYDFAGLDEFISKFKNMEKKIPNVKLIIVGDGPHKNELQKQIIKQNLENKIIITGFVDQKEIPKYLSLADICINTFEINNITKLIIPTKILEYMACGKPVITTPLPGIKEFFSEENYGVLFSEMDTFHDSVIKLFLDNKKRIEMGRINDKYVKNNLDWNMIVKSLIEKFKQVIRDQQLNSSK